MTGSTERRLATAMSLALVITAPAAASQLCPDQTGKVRFDPADHARCEALWLGARSPSAADGTPKPLDVYEAQVGEFFKLACHRDPALRGAGGQGWANDPKVRDTGPYVAYRTPDGGWDADYHGYHAPVVIWYSPAMVQWLQANRPLDGPAPKEAAPVPDGVMIVKEMYTAPAARCADQDIATLAPANGIAYMVRDSKASHDGWFWGYWGDYQGDKDPNIDWPAREGNGPPYAGFGQYCVNCHASAQDNSTFSALQNITGDSLVFLSANWLLTQVEGEPAKHVPEPADAPGAGDASRPLPTVPAAFGERFARPPGSGAIEIADITLASMSYDNVWVQAGEPVPLASEYVTSDQCLGCHDAGSTGLSYAMSMPNPHGTDLINLSPYATWRTSPMGLAGRDPIFFAQLASEEAFHPEALDLVWNTCFGCHGILGQRQFQLDKANSEAECENAVFSPDMVNAIPYDNGKRARDSGPHYDPAHARYGALARDGISCLACHRTVLTPEQTAAAKDEPQNTCVRARQKALNVDIGNFEGFAKTFTGSFLVDGPETVLGPFADPKTTPMQHAVGITPAHDPAIASSEQCGTCHVVHLPILWSKKASGDAKAAPVVIGDTFEQTTYAEWLFSAFRTGDSAALPEGEKLPGGAGATPVSCAGCHMESHDEQGTPFTDKIASIQERSNMPEVAYALDAAEIDLPMREGFARHTLVGLNLFLVKMAEQFPDVLGLNLVDPMLVDQGMPPIRRTEQQMVDNATRKVADIAIDAPAVVGDQLLAQVRIRNLVGHKFPSGVSFRRAFVDFEVLDAGGNALWRSGATDSMGVLTGPDGQPVKGEIWYDQACTKIAGQDDYQPHYQAITRQDQVQIYQEVKLDPGNPETVTGLPSCDEGAPVEASAGLTTSFLSICHTRKDNRLLPAGMLPMQQRAAIGKALGLVADGEAEKLAAETGATGIDHDPDYETGGSDTVEYRVALSELGAEPAAVRATLYYQATPPFYLQDRFCNGTGSNRDRLFHIAGLLDVDDTPIADWKFRLVSTGAVTVGQ